MTDEASQGPTPQQLAAADLVAVTTWEAIEAAYANGQGPLRSYNAAAKKFPPVNSGYMAAPKPPPVVDYTITFNAEGGAAVASITVQAGASTGLMPATRTGYTFDGWFTEPTGGSEVAAPYTPTASATLYAQWTAVATAGLAFGTHAGGIDWPASPDNAAAFAIAKELGCTYTRVAVDWNYSQGSWTSLYESDDVTLSPTAAAAVAAYAATAKEYGLTTVFVVDGCLAPAQVAFPSNGQYDAGKPIASAAFAAAMGWIVAQPGLQGQHWEIINEPDDYQYGSGAQLQMTPEVYAQALKLAHAAMKAADPTCVVHIGPVAVIAGGSDGWDWLHNCFAYDPDVFTYADVLSFHAYLSPQNEPYNDAYPTEPTPGLDGSIEMLAAWLTSIATPDNGLPMPLWLTETGVLSSGTGLTPDNTPATQATLIAGWFTRLKAMYPVPEVAIQYTLQDYNGPQGDWGLLYQSGAEKPAFAALQELFG